MFSRSNHVVCDAIERLRRCVPRVLACAALLLAATMPPLAAQQVGQVADLFTGTGFEQSSFSSGENGVVGGLTYFALQDREHGRELWVTDGTAANTRLFADICPGLCSSNPTSFFVNGTRLVFSADDGRHGPEPWLLHAGDAAPAMIQDLNPGAEGSSPTGFTAQPVRVGSTVATRFFFSAHDREHGRELWRLDLSAPLAMLEADIEPGIDDSSPEMIGPVDSGFKLLVIATTSAHGREPYLLGYSATIGPPSSVELLMDTTGDGGVGRAAVLGSKAWFMAFDGGLMNSARASVWSTDGTAVNTIKLLALESTDALVPNISLNRMFFTASTSSTGKELYVSDGSVAGTGLLKDILPGTASGVGSSPPVARGGAMLFLANDGSHGTELWSSNGTAAGTVLLKELVAGSGGITSGTLVRAANNSLVYVTNTAQLWRSDGTAAGTSNITNLGSMGTGAISGLTPTSGGGMLFGFNIAGVEPWFSDGSIGDAVLLGNFNDGVGNANPEAFAPIGERMSFMASDDTFPFGMHATSGSGAPAYADQQFIPLGYLDGRLLAGTGFPNDMYLTDGSVEGTTILPGVEPRSSNNYGPPFRCSATVNGAVYFVGRDPSSSRTELYRSDGSASGAVKMTDTNATGGLVNSCFDDSAHLVAFNGGVLFTGAVSDSATGVELMRFNGVDAAQLVADINPGASDSFPLYLTALGNKVVFNARNLLSGFELWISDGSAQGTRLLKDIEPGLGDSRPESLVVAGSLLFFTADTRASGRELWVTDGTTAGTRLVADLYPGPGSAIRQGVFRALAVQGRRVFFHATDPAGDCALFVSDGSAAGTHCAIDTAEGLTAANLDEVLALSNGVVAFSAWRDGDGDEVRALHAGRLLPLTDGDIRPGSASSQPMLLTATARGMLYFSADDGSTGREVWRLDLTDFLFADGFE